MISGNAVEHNSGSPPHPASSTFFATLDFERPPSYCVPRSCKITFTRIVLERLETEVSCLFILARIQNVRRSVRSNEIIINSNQFPIDFKVDETLQLSYPHNVKKEGTLLHIALQRRKRYKTKHIPGYKTLGSCAINLAYALQTHSDRELILQCSTKSGPVIIGKISMLGPFCLPIVTTTLQNSTYSDEDEASSDTDAIISDEEYPFDNQLPRRDNKKNRVQNPLKHVIGMLRRKRTVNEIEFMEDDDDIDLDGVSESDEQYFDKISIRSSAKPQIHPIIRGGSSPNNALFNNHSGESSSEAALDESNGIKRKSVSPEPPTILLTALLAAYNPNTLPSKLIMTSADADAIRCQLVSKGYFAISVASKKDVHQVLNYIVKNLQSFCRSNSRSPQPIQLVVIGSEKYFSTFLAPYVELFSACNPELQRFIFFQLIPISNSALDESSHEDLEKVICSFDHSTMTLKQIPVNEVLISYKDSEVHDFIQTFVPFIYSVKVNGTDGEIERGYEEDDESAQHLPPSPPESELPIVTQPQLSLAASHAFEFIELQVDFWRGKDSGKNSIKGCFKTLTILRTEAGLQLNVISKEKSKRIIKLGKKPPESTKPLNYENISRIICTAKNSMTFKVTIDNQEWHGVKFFQVSSQWASHVKIFPVSERSVSS